MTHVASVHCPALDELERAITAGALEGELRAHLEICASCREQEVMIRENLEFMGGVMERFGPGGLGVPSKPALEPDALPGFLMVREIARGGQGTVFEAIQLETKRRVAVKIIDMLGEELVIRLPT